MIQVMDDRWEKEVTEFGAINVTGFRVVDFSRKFARDFEIWKRTGISVSVLQIKCNKFIKKYSYKYCVNIYNRYFILCMCTYI